MTWARTLESVSNPRHIFNQFQGALAGGLPFFISTGGARGATPLREHGRRYTLACA